MQKPKKYDWKDSNLALFGSDTERQVRWPPGLERSHAAFAHSTTHAALLSFTCSGQEGLRRDGASVGRSRRQGRTPDLENREVPGEERPRGCTSR